MTPSDTGPELAFHIADRAKLRGTWDIVGERVRRFELHLQGTEIEVERGPITVEGYGVRLLQPKGDHLAPGFQASTDLSNAGVSRTVHLAESSAQNADFPAKAVELPTGKGPAASVPVVDPKLWADPLETLRGYVHAVVEAFRGRTGVALSFGSVKAILSELSLTNSSGARVQYPSTLIDLELAVKAFGGPEGAPPGEYWVTDSFRRLDAAQAVASVDAWSRYAQDVRRAKPPPSGELTVVLPPDVLSGILIPVIDSRFSGAARLRQIAPEPGTKIGPETLTVRDEAVYPWSVGSSPYDDEGTPSAGHPLIAGGAVTSYLNDSLYGAALGVGSTGNANRTAIGPTAQLRFAHAPGPGASTVVVAAGDGGSTEELLEAAGDGVYVTQLGWASPDPISSAFGGEIRIGYRIRNGKLAEPVRGGTVGGVVLAPPGAPSLFGSLAAIGSRSELTGSLVSPTLVVRPLTVAGASV